MKKLPEETTHPKQRTPQQGKAIHVFCELLAKAMNEMGLDQRKVLKPGIEIPWTKDAIKTQIWHPIQEAMYNTNSTIFLHKQEQIDKIHEVIMRELGKNHGVEYIKFPNDEQKQFEKVSHGQYKGD